MLSKVTFKKNVLNTKISLELIQNNPNDNFLYRFHDKKREKRVIKLYKKMAMN